MFAALQTHHHHYIDNEVARIAVRNGASPSLRYLKRAQNVSLAFLRDLFSTENHQDADGNALHLLDWIQTESNTADIFTKILARTLFERHRKVIYLAADHGVESERKAKLAAALASAPTASSPPKMARSRPRSST